MTDRPASADATSVLVWDRFVRVFHWTLVAAFVVTYSTEHELMFLHVWAGYLIAALLALRVVWGLVGPRHARFSDFVYRPRKVIDYLRDLRAFRARRYIGHSPAGGAMVIALMLVLAATVATGIAADGGGGERGGGFVGAVHQLLADLALVLILLHVAGVIWTSLVHRENLVRAMLTGRKRP